MTIVVVIVIGMVAWLIVGLILGFWIGRSISIADREAGINSD